MRKPRHWKLIIFSIMLMAVLVNVYITTFQSGLKIWSFTVARRLLVGPRKGNGKNEARLLDGKIDDVDKDRELSNDKAVPVNGVDDENDASFVVNKDFDDDLGVGNDETEVDLAHPEERADDEEVIDEKEDEEGLDLEQKGAENQMGDERDGNPDVSQTGPVNKVILLTYMRSGSSYTGFLLSRSPDVFYVYEPLFSLQKDYHLRTKVSYLHKDSIQIAGEKKDFYEPNSLAVETIHDILSCKLEKVDMRTLHQTHMKRSSSTKQFGKCMASANDDYSTQDCVDDLRSVCERSKISLVKTIRFTMKQARALLDMDPTIKILHLIRDSRGMMLSQAGRRYRKANYIAESRSFCKRIQEDIEEHKTIAQQYPGRSLLVRYEDIVQSPVEAMTQIFSFLDQKMTEDTAKKLRRIKRGTDIPYRWRNLASFKFVAAVEKGCGKVLEETGYVPVKTKRNFKNPNFSVIESNFGSSLPMKKVLLAR